VIVGEDPFDTILPVARDVIIDVGGVVSRAVTVTAAGESWTFPLLSIARLLIVTGPGELGVQL
jgi:hypothetical protein